MSNALGKIHTVASLILNGTLDAYEAGHLVRQQYGVQGVLFVAQDLKLAPSLRGEFLIGCGVNNLQVDAKPVTKKPFNQSALKSKEATLPDTIKVATEEEFLAQVGAAPVSLEAGLDLPLGHPVVGSSPGSVYFVTAKLDGLMVAMRWKGAQLSIRIAGPKLAEYTDRLTAPGIFANHAAEGYFSAHLGQVGNIDDLAGSVSAQMLYANVLAAIGGDLALFSERAPYAWRKWVNKPNAPAAEATAQA